MKINSKQFNKNIINYLHKLCQTLACSRGHTQNDSNLGQSTSRMPNCCNQGRGGTTLKCLEIRRVTTNVFEAGKRQKTRRELIFAIRAGYESRLRAGKVLAPYDVRL